MEIVMDPSFLMSRRGSDWIARVQRDGEGAVLAYPQRFSALRHDHETLRHFRAPFGGTGWAYHDGAIPSSRNDQLTKDLRVRVDDSGLGLAAEIAADCFQTLCAKDSVLVARRRDCLDLIAQLDIPLLQVGRSVFEAEFDQRIRPLLSEPLAQALHRRTRYLAWVVASGSEKTTVQVADIGRGQTY